MASKVNPDVLAAMVGADLHIVVETDDYAIYSDGSLDAGPFGTYYRLAAITFDGARVHLAEASLNYSTFGGWTVNLGSTSSTSDPVVLRAKADILSRMADILAAAKMAKV